MPTRRRLRHIGVLRTATVLSLVYGAVGAVILIPTALVGLLFLPDARPGAVGSASFVQSAVFSPVLYAFVGWPVTALVVIAYNVVARWVGGIEYYVDEETDPLGGDEAPEGSGEST